MDLIENVMKLWPVFLGFVTLVVILARVIQVYESSNQVQLQPLNSTAGNRRSKPSQKKIRRECYNVYRIADQEITMSILRGAI